MVIRRSPSEIGSVTCGTRGLPSGDTPEHRTDRHSEPGQVALTENVARHDLARRENVGVRSQALRLSSLIYFHSEIRERDSRPQRIAVERRPVNSLRPVRLWWMDTFRAAVIQSLVIETARLYCSIEFKDDVLELLCRQSKGNGQIRDVPCSNRRKD